MQMPSEVPAAPALALVGRGLRDRLDRQPLHLEPLAVAGDAGRAGVDHVPDAGHGQRGLGHVGGQHDPAARCAAANTRCCSAVDSRANSGSTSVVPAGSLPPPQRVGGVADLPLAGEEHQDVARRLGAELVDGVADRLIWSRTSRRDHLRRRRPRSVSDQRPVADLDRVRAAGHLARSARPSKCVGEPLRVDRRRGDDDLQVRALGQQLLEVAEQEVDVEAALVGLVDDDRVVRRQHAGRAGSRRAGCRRSSA